MDAYIRERLLPEKSGASRSAPTGIRSHRETAPPARVKGLRGRRASPTPARIKMLGFPVFNFASSSSQ